MPAERVSMRRVREILRLKFACGSSDRAIAVAVSVARSTVQLCLSRFATAGHRRTAIICPAEVAQASRSRRLAAEAWLRDATAGSDTQETPLPS